MLSYRHGFHAGNFIDVHKHITLMLLLESLKKKDTPFCYIDTHAGAANYDLRSDFAQKNREYETGIGRLWGLNKLPSWIAAYLDAVKTVNPDLQKDQNGPRYYPGSPVIARRMLRSQDRMILMELHNTEAPILKEYFKDDPQVSVHHRDGFEGLGGMVPSREKRGLVLVDPAYEVKGEFDRVVEVLTDAWNKWPAGVYAVWYPVQKKQPVPRFHYDLRNSGMKKIYLHEFSVIPDAAPNRLSGTGMVIINPPWKFDKQIKAVLHWLVPVLDRGSHLPARCEWLVPE